MRVYVVPTLRTVTEPELRVWIATVSGSRRKCMGIETKDYIHLRCFNLEVINRPFTLSFPPFEQVPRLVKLGASFIPSGGELVMIQWSFQIKLFKLTLNTLRLTNMSLNFGSSS